MTDAELNVALEQYVKLNEQAKALCREIEKLKTSIIEAHNGEATKVTENYQSKLSLCTRMTLLEAQVQQKYNVTFTDEDYRATPYNRLNVSLRKN